MKKTAAILICGLTLAVAGCGDNSTERAVTGATTGAIAGSGARRSSTSCSWR